MDTIFFFRICSAFSSNDWKNALQHLKNSTLLHFSMLLKHCNLQFKQILAQQVEISFIYTRFWFSVILPLVRFICLIGTPVETTGLQLSCILQQSAICCLYSREPHFVAKIRDTQGQLSAPHQRDAKIARKLLPLFLLFLCIHMTLKDLSNSASD